MGLVKDGVKSTSTPTPKSTYVDHSKGQREGAIGHYASRITAAFIMAGLVTDEKTAASTFKKLHEEIAKDF